MPRLALNKSALHRETRRLAQYRRALPSLDLKRRQLVAERQGAARALASTTAEVDRLREGVRQQLPMLAFRRVSLKDLAVVREIRLGERNVLGSRLPVLESIEVQPRDYGLLARPQWVDVTSARLQSMLVLQVQVRVRRRQLEILQAAVAKATQRVNLFEKVLIPRTQERIRRLRIHLGEGERAAVIRAKIAKRKHGYGERR